MATMATLKLTFNAYKKKKPKKHRTVTMCRHPKLHPAQAWKNLPKKNTNRIRVLEKNNLTLHNNNDAGDDIKLCLRCGSVG
ncbi:hypothetical protein T03_5411 [Trichinella britovi]|uniref:Uncharacterized protein n=1 Tax=Trichinella britovi TaxID=45882 RepID=A0A0V1CUF9_TRIBR|nr:hypothetical protein T03_5411 [Trichinella britovi]